MDDIDGLTLLRVIRKHPKTQGMPFIMATGRSDKEQVKEAISFGVNNYIIKPFDANTMKKRIEAVIGALS
jgi:two-component system chemotaxis response regulator CheY